MPLALAALAQLLERGQTPRGGRGGSESRHDSDGKRLGKEAQGRSGWGTGSECAKEASVPPRTFIIAVRHFTVSDENRERLAGAAATLLPEMTWRRYHLRR